MPPANGDKLTTDQRACLLRAAREKVQRLSEEWGPLKSQLDVHAAQRRHEILSEISCLQHAITWLWRQNFQ